MTVGRGRMYILLALLAAAATGCRLLGSTCEEEDPDCVSRLTGRGVGGLCERTLQCRTGLTCQEGACQPAGSAATSEPCSLTEECGQNLYCSHERVCAPAGDGGIDAPCVDTADCSHGLVCEPGPIPIRGACALRGTGDLGVRCSIASDCRAGLTCLPLAIGNFCQSLPATSRELPPLPIWDGASCDTAPDQGTPIAYFDVPRGDVDDDFYRLPFPNDIRLIKGTLDLSGHPRPPDQPGYLTTSNFIEASDGRLDGFGTTPVVYFRFSHRLSENNVEIQQALRLVDITTDSPNYGNELDIEWLTDDQSNYLCPYWLAVRVPPEQPLRRNTTYAVLIANPLQSAADGRFAVAPDLTVMLDDEEPDDKVLADAHSAYRPLREFLKEKNLSKDSVLNAAVFTTADPTEPMRALRKAVTQTDLPSVSDLVLCEEGVISPCQSVDVVREDIGDALPAKETRGACQPQPGFATIHGHIRLPNFQEGTPPYELEGGGITRNADGSIEPVSSVDVCFALSVPEGDVPDNGFPVLIHAHGTRGSFAGQFGPGGLAATLAESEVRAAVLAIDMPQHGSRRGTSTEDPAVLFFNLANPEASRGNVLQGAADLISLVRWVKGESIPATYTGQEVKFNGERIAVMGHSQGATHAALMLPYEPDVAGFVLSGLGGHLATSLLYKKKPFEVERILGALLVDMNQGDIAPEEGLAAKLFNPVLALVQMFYDPADPINFASLLYSNPPPEAPTGHHVFMTSGIGDSYTPLASQAAYATAANLPQVLPTLQNFALPAKPAPASDTVTVGGVPRTVGLRQYEPSSNNVDGHFVATRDTEAGYQDVVQFLEQVLSGETPSIGRQQPSP